MKIQILTPEWNREIDEVEAVFLPGTLGQFEVLRNHAPIISTLEAGDVRWRSSCGEESLAVSGGVVKVMDNVIQLCVEV